MKRVYADTSSFRAPFDDAVLQGLGSVRRDYMSIANFRAGYDEGYFQDNTLFGLGATPNITAAPVAFRRFVETGAPMSTWRRDLGSASNQVPRWAWLVLGAGALALAYRGFKNAKSSKKKSEE